MKSSAGFSPPLYLHGHDAFPLKYGRRSTKSWWNQWYYWAAHSATDIYYIRGAYPSRAVPLLKIINKLHLDCSLTTNHTMNEGKEEAYDALIYQERACSGGSRAAAGGGWREEIRSCFNSPSSPSDISHHRCSSWWHTAWSFTTGNACKEESIFSKEEAECTAERRRRWAGRRRTLQAKEADIDTLHWWWDDGCCTSDSPNNSRGVREHWGKERIQNLLQQRMHQPSSEGRSVHDGMARKGKRCSSEGCTNKCGQKWKTSDAAVQDARIK